MMYVIRVNSNVKGFNYLDGRYGSYIVSYIVYI